jgi:hypothetical protein
MVSLTWNAILLNGVLRPANREIDVPGFRVLLEERIQ